MTSELPSTLGELRAAVSAGRVMRRPVKDEIRENLIARLRAKQPIFPGIIGFDETVVPQIVNAVLSRHNFILLGLRGQAKSRILRALSDLLDETIPVVKGARSTTIPSRHSVPRAAHASEPRATTLPSPGCPATRGTSRSLPRPT